MGKVVRVALEFEFKKWAGINSLDYDELTRFIDAVFDNADWEYAPRELETNAWVTGIETTRGE